MKYDPHTHYYPGSFFEMIRDLPSEFSFDKDPTGRTIIKFRGARFFGIMIDDPLFRPGSLMRVWALLGIVCMALAGAFYVYTELYVKYIR